MIFRFIYIRAPFNGHFLWMEEISGVFVYMFGLPGDTWSCLNICLLDYQLHR